MGEPDEEPFRSADVAEPIRILILDNFAYELRAAVEKPSKRLVDVVHGEHDSEVSKRVYWSGAVICDGSRCEEAGELDTAVAIRRTHHSNLDALAGQAGDTSRPFSFDCGPPFELETDLSKKIYCPFEVLDDDSHVVHPFERHVWNL